VSDRKSKKGQKKTRWTRDFKLRVMSLMDAAADVSALAAELGVNRELLYRWRRKYLAHGPDGLQQIGRPLRVPAGRDMPLPPLPPPPPEDSLAAAQRRIAELERKVGQQQLDLDFFRAALWHVGERRRSNGGPGETGSTR
jgi:transposase-like protein